MTPRKNTPPMNLSTKTLERTHGKNIIAIASGKGGVGKTWLSITLAGLLAETGKSVLLFDGDFGLANVDIQLGLSSSKDLASVLTGATPMNGAIVPYESGGFDVLAGRSGTGALASIPYSRLQLLHDDLLLLSTHYDYVVVDLGAGLEKSVRLFAGSAGIVLVMCTDEPTSLTDAYAFIKVIHKEAPEATIQIVVNSASSIKEGERTYNTLSKACDNFLGFEPTLGGIIRRDTHVKDSIRSQTPTLTAYPSCEALKDVKILLQKIG